MAMNYNTWTTPTNSGSGFSGDYIYVDDGTGGRYVTTYNTYNTYGMDTTTIDHTYAISKEVTKKDLKAMKDEIRKYMKDQMLEDAKEIAGELFEDIEKLKKEKTQLKKSVTELKNQVKKVQADVKTELEDLEDLLERRAKEIIKFSHMDFSQS
jgi:predicted nuclease with TOPRIM domain